MDQDCYVFLIDFTFAYLHHRYEGKSQTCVKYIHDSLDLALDCHQMQALFKGPNVYDRFLLAIKYNSHGGGFYFKIKASNYILWLDLNLST